MEEPTALVRWTMYFFGSGVAVFPGAAGILFLVLQAVRGGRVGRLLTATVLTVGVFLILCGSPVLPVWYVGLSGLWFVYLSIWRLRERFLIISDASRVRPLTQKLFGRRTVLVTAIVWLGTGLLVELPYQVLWPVPIADLQLLVVADSVTAGLTDGEETWPMLVARDLKLNVVDASQPGATLESAIQQNARLADATGLLILEIGGNDLLEGLPVDQFTKSLDRLLSSVVAPGRTVLMFELPLPPLCSRYGAAQRRLAR